MKIESEPAIYVDLSSSETSESLVRREPEVSLRRQVQYGVCLWWSDELPCFVHPDDWRLVEKLVPGNRVFKKEECEDFADRKLGYSRLSYGAQVFRALPAIWYPLTFEGYEVGDRVQIKSKLGRHRSMICTICEIRWNRISRRVQYSVESTSGRIGKRFLADDLQPALRLEGHFSKRELSLASRARLS